MQKSDLKNGKQAAQVLTKRVFYGIIGYKIGDVLDNFIVQFAILYDGFDVKIHVFIPKRG